MKQWCLWFHFQAFEISMIIFWSVIMHPLVTQDLLTNTVIKQWWNSDATVMPFDFGSFMSFAQFWDVIAHIVSCCNALGVCLKNSEQTLMRQWWNSDGTVMPLIWALSHHCQAFEMSLIIFYLFAMPWECVWRHKTFWQKQWQNSDATVIEQWLNSDAFDLSFLMLISRFLDVMDHIISFNNALEVWLLIWWWNKTFWQKTVM
jgi:hypothetical protein